MAQVIKDEKKADILALAAEGLSKQAIAIKLKICHRTVTRALEGESEEGRKRAMEARIRRDAMRGPRTSRERNAIACLRHLHDLQDNYRGIPTYVIPAERVTYFAPVQSDTQSLTGSHAAMCSGEV